MKKLFLLTLLILVAVPLAAEEATGPASEAPDLEALARLGDDAGEAPIFDPTTLSAEGFEAWMDENGFFIPETMATQPPPCPQVGSCTSPVGICGTTVNCPILATLQNCCTNAGGQAMCCATGTIKVEKCPCRGPGCPGTYTRSWYCG